MSYAPRSELELGRLLIAMDQHGYRRVGWSHDGRFVPGEEILLFLSPWWRHPIRIHVFSLGRL